MPLVQSDNQITTKHTNNYQRISSVVVAHHHHHHDFFFLFSVRTFYFLLHSKKYFRHLHVIIINSPEIMRVLMCMLAEKEELEQTRLPNAIVYIDIYDAPITRAFKWQEWDASKVHSIIKITFLLWTASALLGGHTFDSLPFFSIDIINLLAIVL